MIEKIKKIVGSYEFEVFIYYILIILAIINFWQENYLRAITELMFLWVLLLLKLKENK